MGRIGRSIELFKESWGVLKQDRELVWLPVMSALLSLVVAAIVLVPIGLTQDFDAVSSVEGAQDQVSAGVVVALAVLGVVLAFVSIFFRGALVSGAHERMTGGDPTVRSAIAGALERLPKLFSWAVITTIVGSILRAIEERSGFIGRIVVSVIGMAWAVTTFLVIPVIIIENVGAIDATKRSVALFRRTWGENLAAQLGFGLIGLLVFLPLIIVGVIGIAVGSLIGFVLIGLAIAGAVVATAVLSALSAVFQTALYHYAASSELVDGFDGDVMQSAFASKR